jgi:UDP-glucuronate 4-epimerase
MARYLVTGCAGFIGSHVCEKLISLGHEVIGIDNFDPFYDRWIKESNMNMMVKSPLFKFYEADICDKDNWKHIEQIPDAVIHFAAKAGVRPSIQEPESYIMSNIMGTQMVLNWMVEKKISQFVFAGSSSVYGNNTKIPFSEDDGTDNPVSPYAYTKKACELMISSYSQLYDIKAVCVRLFTVFGPRQRPDLAIHKFTDLIFSGNPVVLFGDGSSFRDYTYVDDIVHGILQSITFLEQNTAHAVFEIINLGNNNPVKLKDLISTLMELTNANVTIQYDVMQAGDVDRTYADITKAGHLLGFYPETEFRKGLVQFLDWYKTHHSRSQKN